MEVLAAFLTGTSVFLILAYVVRARALRPDEARLRILSASSDVGVTRNAEGVTLLRRDTANTIVGRMMRASDYSARWQFELERAALKLRPSEYFLIRLMMAIVSIALITVIGRSAVAFAVSIPLGFLMYMLPSYYVRIRTQRRLGAIEKQLVETITLIANSLRAGFAFAQGVDVAAKRIGEPMSSELGRLLLDIGLGMTTEDALEAMNQRIGSDDVDMVVTAILIQRNSGGNLAEVLETVAETIRDRERIRGEIKTLTSSQRFTGWVLSAWPVLLAFVFFLMNPDMMSLMWKETAGIFLLMLWGFLNLMGVITLRKILDIEI